MERTDLLAEASQVAESGGVLHPRASEKTDPRNRGETAIIPADLYLGLLLQHPPRVVQGLPEAFAVMALDERLERGERLAGGGIDLAAVRIEPLDVQIEVRVLAEHVHGRGGLPLESRRGAVMKLRRIDARAGERGPEQDVTEVREAEQPSHQPVVMGEGDDQQARIRVRQELS